MARLPKPAQPLEPAEHPASVQDLNLLARRYAPAALRKLMDIASARKSSVALRAIEMLLDRAYGKPRQAVDVTQVIAHSTPAELQALAKRILVERGAEIRAHLAIPMNVQGQDPIPPTNAMTPPGVRNGAPPEKVSEVIEAELVETKRPILKSESDIRLGAKDEG